MSTASDSTADSAKKGKGKGSWFKTPKKGEKGAASPGGKSPSHSQSDKDKDTGTVRLTP